MPGHDFPAKPFTKSLLYGVLTNAIYTGQVNHKGTLFAGRFGPDQSGVIQAQAWASRPSTGGITLTFVLGTGATARYGKLGNLDRVFVAHGRTLAGVPVGSGQGFQWTAGSGATLLFANGDNNTKYHVTLDFTQTLLDKLGAVVPMGDCRKMYMVFAPRFENVEQDLQDGCFLTVGVGTSNTTWTVDDTSKLTGGRYFIGTPTSEERIQLLSVVSGTQITGARGFEASTPGPWPAGTRLKRLSPVSGFPGNVEWGCTISNIAVTGNGSLKVGGGSERIEETDALCKYTGFWEDYAYGGAFPSQWWSKGHAKRTAPSSALDVRKVTLRYSYPRQHDLYLGTFLNTDCGKVSVSVDGVATTHDLYLNEYGGTTANLKVRGAVAAGTHTVDAKGRVTGGTTLVSGDIRAHTHVATDIVSGALPFTIQKAGTAIGTRRALNLIEGANVALTVTDDSGNDRVNVTVAAASGATTHNLLSATHPDTVAAAPTLGDLIAANGTPAWARLAGNTTATRKFLWQTGTGTVSALPAWDTLLAGDLPAHTHAELDVTSLATDLTNRLVKGGGWAVSKAAVINSSGQLDGAAGTATDCVLVNGSSAAKANASHTHAATDIVSGTLDNARTSGAASATASTLVLRDGSGGASFSYVAANNQWAYLDSHFQSFECGAYQTVGGPFENMAKYSEDFTVATWDKNPRNSGGGFQRDTVMTSPGGRTRSRLLVPRASLKPR